MIEQTTFGVIIVAFVEFENVAKTYHMGEVAIHALHDASFTVEKGIRPGMNSFNHYSLGSCTEWMYEYCLGIHPHFEAPGFRKVTFRPFPDPTGAITWAKGHYDTDFGRIEAAWEANGKQVAYRVTVPAAIENHFDFGAMTVVSETRNGNEYEFVLQQP